MRLGMASQYFNGLRAAHPARAPNLSLQKYLDEVTDISANDDCFSLPCAPVEDIKLSGPERPADLMYVWLVLADDVLYALEHGKSGQSTRRGRLAHTNLSGGADAHVGGELWFEDRNRIWFTGASSRYEARSAEELISAIESFRQAGYWVCSDGWDIGTDRPSRFVRSREWLHPL